MPLMITVNKDTGRFLRSKTMGMKDVLHADGSRIGSEPDLPPLKPGEKALPFDTDLPPSNEHVWSGEAWALDPELEKARDYEAERRTLVKSDRLMARITEDLIDTLIAKGDIVIDDLPPEVKTVLDERVASRARMKALE
jgi:hypothetical protein